MNPEAQVLARAAPEGSLRWHALLYAPRHARPALAAILAFEAELRATTAIDQDHTVAHAKLQWWRAEVDRLQARRPVHPVTRSLHELAASQDWSLLHESLAGADLDLSCLTYATDQELGAYLYRSCGALHGLAAGMAAPGAKSGDVRQFGSAIGCLVRMAEILRDVGRDARAGRVFVPLERLERHRIDVPALQSRRLEGPARACLRELARKARSDWATATQSTPPLLREAATGQRALAGLHLALLDELERRDFDVGQARFEVRPWRRLWSGWRSARS